MSHIVRLKATVNSYDWGKIASHSLVAKFGESGSGLPIDSSKKYSELWVGTHPSGTASVFQTGESLTNWIKHHPNALGSELESENGLCFLFKILSIGKALSIQAHPNKKRAEELFASFPEIYKDNNHKPEMACALTDFEALLGFDQIDQIIFNLENTPELLALLKSTEPGVHAWNFLKVASTKQERKAALKEFFSAVISADATKVVGFVDDLVTRILKQQAKAPENKKHSPALASLDKLNAVALRLHEEFPHDVGIFCAYILCYRKLSPGEAVFLTSNEPHAYLSGECVEVMANSDNVIRAALTPKYKDLNELATMLTYNEPGETNEQQWHPSTILLGTSRDKHTRVFSPPDAEVSEFQLERTVVRRINGEYELKPGSYASVLFVTEGEGLANGTEALFSGVSFFLPANTPAKLSGDCVVYRVTKRGSIE